jgi:hypothetical protein
LELVAVHINQLASQNTNCLLALHVERQQRIWVYEEQTLYHHEAPDQATP